MAVLKMGIANWIFSKRRLVNLAVGISALLLYEVARVYYRPFIYARGINDLHIADTLGNSLGTVTAVFMFVALLGRSNEQEHFLMHCAVIGAIVYEVIHPLLGKPVDLFDIVATILAGLFCEGLYRLLHGPQQVVVSKLEPTL